MPGLRSLVARRRATLPSPSPLTTPIDLGPSPKSAEAQLISDPPEWPENNGDIYPNPAALSTNIISDSSTSNNSHNHQDVKSSVAASCSTAVTSFNSELSWILADKMSNLESNLDQCSNHTPSKDSGYGFLNSNDECSSPGGDESSVNVLSKNNTINNSHVYTSGVSSSLTNTPNSLASTPNYSANTPSYPSNSHSECQIKDDSNNIHSNSAERIVIKMKLLPMSLDKDSINATKNNECDITCIESDQENISAETPFKTKASKYTRWTIDTIINGPVVKKEPPDDILSNKNSFESNIENLKVKQEYNCEENSLQSNIVDSNSNLMHESVTKVEVNESNFVDSKITDNGDDCFKSDGKGLTGKSIKLYFGNSLIGRNIVGLQDLKNFTDENSSSSTYSSSEQTTETDQSSHGSCSSSRRQSHCSDPGSDSDAAMGKNNSSSGCSLVIKRVENSDCYSCVRSNQINRKDLYESSPEKKTIASCRPKRKAAVIASEKCLISLSNFDAYYRQESSKSNNTNFKVKSVKSSKLESQPNSQKPFGNKTSESKNISGLHIDNSIECSVQLCDVFRNQSLSGLVCPGCCQAYDAQNDAVIDLGEKTLSLECVKCKWLVIRRLIQKEIDVPNAGLLSSH